MSILVQPATVHSTLIEAFTFDGEMFHCLDSVIDFDCIKSPGSIKFVVGAQIGHTVGHVGRINY